MQQANRQTLRLYACVRAFFYAQKFLLPNMTAWKKVRCTAACYCVYAHMYVYCDRLYEYTKPTYYCSKLFYYFHTTFPSLTFFSTYSFFIYSSPPLQNPNLAYWTVGLYLSGIPKTIPRQICSVLLLMSLVKNYNLTFTSTHHILERKIVRKIGIA